MKVNKTITHISPNEDIKIMDKNTDIYYDVRGKEDDSLEAKITKNGVLVPLHIVGSPKGQKTLVSGMRRLNAARAVGLETIPVIFHHPDEWPEDPVEQHMLMIQYNKSRHKMPSEIWQEGQVIREYNRKHKVKGKSSELIVKELGHMSVKTYERLTAVMTSGNNEVIERMDFGEISIAQAYDMVKGKDKTPDPPMPEDNDEQGQTRGEEKEHAEQNQAEEDNAPRPTLEFKKFVKELWEIWPVIQKEYGQKILPELSLELKEQAKTLNAAAGKETRDSIVQEIALLCFMIANKE